MRRLVLEAPSATGAMADAKIKIEEVPIPTPASGDVLIKVSAAPLNPSVFGAWKKEGTRPGPVGNEGSGVVVATGGGITNWLRVGQKVGFVLAGSGSGKGQGSYSEYVSLSAITSVFPLPADLPVEAGCSFFVNPYTAAGIVDTARELGHGGFIHTGAASQLGQMLAKLCALPSHNMTVIHVVRRSEQAETLKQLGAAHVVSTGEAGWEATLGALAKELNISLAFDCVAGATTGKLVALLPPKSTTFVYGALSGWTVDGVAATDLIYHQKQLKGWLLTDWIQRGGTLAVLLRIRAASKLVLSENLFNSKENGLSSWVLVPIKSTQGPNCPSS